MDDKIKYLLDYQFNLFHADLIWNALHDESISVVDFIAGYDAIKESERDTDDDEFVPEEFKNLV